MLSDIYSHILSGILSGVYSDIPSDIPSNILFGILSGILHQLELAIEFGSRRGPLHPALAKGFGNELAKKSARRGCGSSEGVGRSGSEAHLCQNHSKSRYPHLAGGESYLEMF